MRRLSARQILLFACKTMDLTSEQQARAARQKQIALAKRRQSQALPSFNTCTSSDCVFGKCSSSSQTPPQEERQEGIGMPDIRVDPAATGKGSDGALDEATANLPWHPNGIQTSGVVLPSPSDTEPGLDQNAYLSSSYVEEGFATHYSTRESPLREEDDEEEGEEFSEEEGLSHPHDSPVKFSQQQMQVLEAVAHGKSVFMTGSAGTGKSFILKYVIRILRRLLGKKSVYVTASTGLAACALNGTTLHSFSGIGFGTDNPKNLARRVLGRKDLRKRWELAKVLIIDEISMIDGELFDKLDYVAKIVRRDDRCFGGIQLIVTGDFFQLPPVCPPNPRKFFAFEAECWNKCFDLQVELEHVFRQSDGVFIKMLNEIRKGVQTPQTLENLRMCYRVLPDDSTGIIPTRLYPLKVDVKHENMQQLKALAATIMSFTSVDSTPNRLHRYMLNSMRAEKDLQLSVGAQVMLIKNLDTSRGLVNGAKGVVVGFHSKYDIFVEKKKDEESKALKGVAHLISPTNLWPVVRFDCGIRTIGPQKENAEDGGVEVASRIQVPLILAWALSVHKCQGMTLSKVETDLSKAFEYGMVYVALSRVKDLDGLHLVGFDPTRIKAHPNVVLFFEKLTGKV